jgi:hypothetical protein
VKITLLNASDLDLPIGPGGIRTDLWFDAQIRGMKPLAFPGTTYDRLAGPFVLKPRQTMTRTVRLDKGGLLAHLRANPNLSLPISGSVLVNPTLLKDRYVAGAGGYAVQFYRLIEQSPVPLFRPEQKQAFLSNLSRASSSERVSLMDAAMNYLKNPEATGVANPEFKSAIRSALGGQSEERLDVTAQSWGTFCNLLITEGNSRSELARARAGSEYWLTRMLSLAGLRGGDPVAFREIATRLSTDNDPIVAGYAKAVLDEIESIAANPASTQPATQPAAPAPARP